MNIGSSLLSSAAPLQVPEVRLFGGLAVTCGPAALTVPAGGRRLLAYLALHPDGVDRRAAAGALWPAACDARAAGNLRSALWRLQRVRCPLVCTEQSTVRLCTDVTVDLTEMEAWADRVLGGAATPADLAVDPRVVADLELLPGWDDGWVLPARERVRLRLLHALDALSRLLRQAGRPVAAVVAGHVAVLAEPLRESGQRVLIEAHQAAGDWIAARRQYDAFRELLRREIGVEPSAELTAVATAGAVTAARGAR